MSLSNNFPAARPTLNLDFANVGALDPRITFTRASIGTFTGSNGLIQTAAAGVPRFDYDPVTRAARGLLIEEQRTNLLTYSEDFSNAAWNKTNTTVTPNSIVSPDGTTSADKLEAATTAFTGVSRVVTATSTALTYSIYAKKGSGATDLNSFGLRNSTTSTNLVIGTFNYDTGVWSGTAGVIVSSAGDGWWRIQIAASSGITVGDSMIVYLGGTGNTETAGEFAYFWGAQLEAGAFATSYIPTVATQVTRSEDFARMTNVSPWYNAAQGTLFYEMTFDASYNYPVTPTFYQSASANGNIIGVYSNTATQFVGLIRSGSVNQASMGVNGTVLGEHKTAIAYSAGSAAVAVDNLAVVTGAPATLPTIDTLGIAGLQSGYTQVGNAVGHIRRITYYPIRVSNAQLQALTS